MMIKMVLDLNKTSFHGNPDAQLLHLSSRAHVAGRPAPFAAGDSVSETTGARRQSRRGG